MNDRVREGRPARIGSIAALVVWAGVLVRVLTEGPDRELIPWYLAGLVLFLVAHVVVLWLPWRSTALLYVALALQAALVLVLLSLDPDVDVLVALLALECYQAAVAFTGRARLAWVSGLVVLIPVSLVMGTGWLDGLAVAFVPMAAGVVLAMFAVVSRDLEVAGAASRDMVAELREAQSRLQAYAGQVEELAAIDERSRVAGQLNASVATMLADALDVARSARQASAGPAAAVAPAAAGEPPATESSVADEEPVTTGTGVTVGRLLERLQELAQQALAQMRDVIAELRPPAGAAGASGEPSPDAASRLPTGAAAESRRPAGDMPGPGDS